MKFNAKMDFDVLDTGFQAFDNREQRVEEAARTVISACNTDQYGRGWRPKGVDEVAILLESLGYSPEIVGELWYPTLFAFAADVTATIEKYVTDDERAERVDTGWFVRSCRDYAIGALYSGPWIIAVLGLAVFGASLWSSLSTPLHLATTIALGIFGALVLSGAFAQAIARRLTFYYLQDNVPLMLWTLDRFTLVSIATFVVVGLLGWLGLRGTYGDQDAAVAMAFFIGSGFFQTSLAPLYTLRKFAWIIVIALVATLLTSLTFVFAFHRIVAEPWEPSVLAAEVGAIGLLVMALTIASLRRQTANAGGAADLVPPANRAILTAALPYASFGALYFTMIVVDHVMAGLHGGFPYRYRLGYELGTDVSLVAIIPVIGVINVVLEQLPRRILDGAAATIGHGTPFDRSMLRFYVRSVAAVVVGAAVTVGFAIVVGTWVLRSSVLGLTGPEAAEADFVLPYAATGYGLLMVGLLNCQLLFFLSRPRPAVAASAAGAAVVLLGAATTIVLGVPVGTTAFALDLGIIVYVVVTTIAAVRTMAHFTFSYYAAY
jgi:hypothetical protein